MSSDEEGDVCRVCRLEGDADEPLIYPCKCAGSVKYVHRDCFQDWIRTSKKRHCEICGHRYTFTKVYPEYIPTIIPAVVWLRQGIRWASGWIHFGFRMLLVAIVWLVVLPIWTMDGFISFIGIPDFIAPDLFDPISSSRNSTLPAFGNLTAIDANVTMTELFNMEFTQSLADFQWQLQYDLLGFTAAVLQPRRAFATIQSIQEAWKDEDARPKAVVKILAHCSSFLLCSQFLAIVLALVLILLIFLREWVTQHEWDQQHMAEHHPPPKQEEGEIDPDEWDVVDGIAWRKDGAMSKADLGKVLSAMRNPTKTASEAASYQLAIDGAAMNQKILELEDARIERLRVDDLRREELIKELRRRLVDKPDDYLGLSSPGSGANELLGASDQASTRDGEASSSSDREQAARSSTDLTSGVGPLTSGQNATTRHLASHPSEPTQAPSPLFSGQAEPISRSVFQRPQSISMPIPSTSLPSAFQPSQAGPSRPSPMQSPDVEFEFSAPEMLAEKGKGKAMESASSDGPGAELEDERILKQEEIQEEIRFDGLKQEDEDVDEDEDETDDDYDTGEAWSDKAWRGSSVTEEVEKVEPPDVDGAVKIEPLDADMPSTEGSDTTVKEETLPEPDFDLDAVRRIVQDPDPPAPWAPLANGHGGAREPVVIPAERLANPEALDAAIDAVLHGPNGDAGPVIRPIDGDEPGNAGNDAPDDNEEVPWEREDWDGVFEIVGLIGPLGGLLTNAFLACIVAFSASTILFGLPISLGRMALGMDWFELWLDVFRASDKFVWQWLIKPVWEVGKEIMLDVVLKPAGTSIRAMEAIVLRQLGLGSAMKDAADATSQSVLSIPNLLDWTRHGWTGELIERYELHVRDNVVTEFLLSAIPSIENLYAAYRQHAFALAVSHTTSDLLFCLAIGYSILIASLGALILLPDAVGSRSIAAIADVLKRHLPFFKLAFFMSLELAIFPLGVGLAMDFATAPWFSKDFSTRLNEITRRPTASLFVCWLMGTLFMYSFANFLGFVRSMCRSGAMFFIRDPSDPTYSAVKDIVDRPSISQLRKLGMSGIMYGVIVYSLFGLMTTLLSLQTVMPILPLRLPDNPISSIPFDLLFLHLAVPPLVEHLRPRHKVKKAWHFWFRYTAGQLRLSELIYGNKHPAERADPSKLWERGFWPLADVVCRLAFGQYDTPASFARVPAKDQVSLLPLKERKNGGVFIMVDERGRPTTQEGKLRLLKQDRLARNNKRDPVADYRILWLPQYWRTRVHVFLGLALLTAGAGIGAVAVVPLVVGRAAMASVLQEEVHDGYSYAFGACITYATYLVGTWTRQKITLSGHADRIRRSNLSRRIKRSILDKLCDMYALTLLYLVLPILVGLNAELYYGLAVRYDFKGVPVVHLWDVWALGTVIDALMATTVSIIVTQRRRRRRRSATRMSLLERLRAYLRSPLGKNFHTFTATMIPTFAWLLLGLVLPSGATAMVTLIMRLVLHHAPSAFQNPQAVYESIPGITFLTIIITAMLVLSRRFLTNRYKHLRQYVIDAEYIVEERPQNYVPESKTERLQTVKGVKVKVLDGQGLNGRPEAIANGGAEQGDDPDGEGVWEDIEEDDAEDGDDLDGIFEREEAVERQRQNQDVDEIGMGGGLTDSGGESENAEPDEVEAEDE